MANEYAQLAIIPRLASALRTQAPSIRLDVVDFQTENHLDALASGEVDLVIGFDAYLDPGLLRATAPGSLLLRAAPRLPISSGQRPAGFWRPSPLCSLPTASAISKGR